MQTVKLTSRREVAPAVYELLFTRPAGWTFEAGQFARIGLAADGAATPALVKKMNALGITCDVAELKRVNAG